MKRAKTKASKKPAKKSKVTPVPKGFRTVTPVLVLRNAAGAIAFYKSAFGAKERSRMPMPDGSIGHAEIQIGDSMIMLGDEMPAMGASAPQTVGGTASSVVLYLSNVDQVFARAVKAGATVEMPLTDMFWGDRYGKLLDPFGHKWALAKHIEDVTPKEMARRSEKFIAGLK